MRSLLPIIFLLLVSCNGKKSTLAVDIKKDTSYEQIIQANKDSDSFNYQISPFVLVKDYPIIKDTPFFIKELKSNFHITGVDSRWGDTVLHETINIFKQLKINGNNKTYYLVEYDWHGNGPNTEYPWKKQFLYDTLGKLIEDFQAMHVSSVNIFPNQNPFLEVVKSTARGNGGHEIYKITRDTLENIYEGYYDYETQTYDAGEDQWVYEPYELRLVTKDFDNDGYNDISFEGELVLTQGVTKSGTWYDFKISGKDTINYSVNNPFKKLPLRYVFLYNPKIGHFQKSHKFSIENPYE